MTSIALPRAAAPASRRAALWLPIVVGLSLFLAGHLVLQSAVFDPPWLLTPLNFIFQTAVPLAAAAIAVRAYRRTGVAAILGLGAGMLATGIGCGILPAILLFASGTNATLTVHNSSAMLAAALQFAAAVVGSVGIAFGARRLTHVVVVYGVVTAAIAAWVTLLLAGLTPAFFVPGKGMTESREVVLTVTVVLLTVTAFAWWAASLRDPDIRFLHWYVPALAILALAFAALVTQSAVGSLVTWVGRMGQYVAAVYMLVAVVSETRAGRDPTALGIRLLQAALPFRSLVESTSDAVLAIDQRGGLVYWNATAQRLFGWESNEVFGASLLAILPTPDATDDERETLRDLIERRATSGHLQVPFSDRDGRSFVGEVTFFASPSDTRLAVCVIADVTERAQRRQLLEERVRERTAALEAANARLEQANADLEKANAAKDEFLGLVSHELKTPITSILAATTLLERHGKADDDGLLDDVAAETSRLARIVDDLLTLARLDAGRQTDTEPVALERLARRAVARVAREHADREILVTAESGVIVEANEDQLTMVMRNYLTNALKYSEAPAPVEVSVVRLGDAARVNVADRGIGIDPSEASALFEPFYRSKTVSGRISGLGIGLAVCRRIVESFGGTVCVAPGADGKGSVFSFELPLVEARADEA